ncbi:hypothetical protein ACQKNO_26000 [Bacillus paramycoides]|uniref:hypothetical protein n=1 Tax=Bacillus paramycoides TaxID=2026194 RepID=UPI003CFE353A
MEKFIYFTVMLLVVLILFWFVRLIFIKTFRRDTLQANSTIGTVYVPLVIVLIPFLGTLVTPWANKVLAVSTSSEFKSFKDLTSGKKNDFSFKNPYKHYGTLDDNVDMCSSKSVDESKKGLVMTDTYSTRKPTPIFDGLGDDIKIYTRDANNHYENYKFIVKGNDGTDCQIVLKGYKEQGKFTVNEHTYAIEVKRPDKGDPEGQFEMSLWHMGDVEK